MDKNFIDQVYEIVVNNITDEKFGSSKLASLIGLSTSQTLRKVKATTGKSVNQYIRELRLKKAAKLIKKTDLTIAEISYKVGFGSQPYFCTAFRKLYGITPGEYKTQNKSLSELESEKIKKRTQSISYWKKAFYFITIVLISVIVYESINHSKSKNTSFTNSIAVLPFRDMSPEDTQWFCDGISDNILTYLSQINDLSVISFTSSSTYRNTDKQIPEIAKELGVSYILEGSVTVYEDRIKVNVQLINANDEHVWSEDYNISFDDVIGIQQNIAKEISKKLEITLSPEEVVTLEKYPTENMEAYHLFLKGRLVNDSRKAEDLKLNIELNKQAVALDSNYAEAYAEIAHSYFLLSQYGDMNFKEAYKKSNYYAEKALKIDPNIYRAYAVKALLIGLEDRVKAKEYFEKAIAINPNDATVHLQYGRYFLTNPNPDLNNFLHQLTIAQQLNPFSKNIGFNFISALILNNKYKEVGDYLNNLGFLYTKMEKLEVESILKAHKNNDWTEAIHFFEKEIKKDPNNPDLYKLLGIAYNEILNDGINAVKFTKKAYEIDSINFSTSENFLDSSQAENTSPTVTYFNELVKANKFKEANKLLQTKNFKSVRNKRQRISSLWKYYYHQGNYKKALELTEDSLFMDNYDFKKVITYAQLGDRKKVDTIINKNILIDEEKAFVYAILKEKDSMYYYLERLNTISGMRKQNGRSEFDLYRKEERFKALLNKNYLPITHWNE